VPITLLNPTTGQPIGAGVSLELLSDLIGPIDPTFVWSVQLFTEPGEHQLFFKTFPLSIGNQRHLVIDASTSIDGWFEQFTGENVQEGQTIRVDAKIQSPDGNTITDQTEGQTRSWSDTSSLYQWIRAAQTGTTGGGLTAEQAEQLETTFSSVTQVVGQGATSIQQLLSDFMQQVPTIRLSLAADPHVVDGDTLIDVSSASGHLIYGYWVEFLVVPEGFGKLNGQAPEYSPRVAQIVEIADFLGTNLAVRVHDLKTPNLVFMWDFWQGWKPHFLQVSVTPGCTISIHPLNLV